MRKRGDGRDALTEAARAEFETRGFDGTNTNVIARRAGYAPQTFYRHFADKLAIFIAVYQAWAEEEDRLIAGQTDVEAIADILIAHHRRHRIFRRSLRWLTVSDPLMAKARAGVRLRQAQRLSIASPAFGALDLASQISAILQVERLCDAIADGEFDACGLSFAESRRALCALLDRYS